MLQKDVLYRVGYLCLIFQFQEFDLLCDYDFSVKWHEFLNSILQPIIMIVVFDSYGFFGKWYLL